MKTKMFLSLLLLASVVACALEAGGEHDTKAHGRKESALVAPVDAPAGPAVVQNDPKQVLQDYDQLMIALTQKFSATLASIADAAKSGALSQRAGEGNERRAMPTHPYAV